MKASQLIIKLQELISKHGDLEVVSEDGQDPSDPRSVDDPYLTKNNPLYWNGNTWVREPFFKL